MARQVSHVIADMIHNRIEKSELSDIQKKYAAEAAEAEGASLPVVLDVESRKNQNRRLLKRLNEDFEGLLNELEICLIRRK
jgi:hypothetical protein